MKTPQIISWKAALCLLITLGTAGCNVELKENSRELEAVQAINNSLHAEVTMLKAQNEELQTQLTAATTQAEEATAQVEATRKEVEDLMNSGPPKPPPAPYEYDVALVTTKGEKMVLTDVTFGKDQRAVHTRVGNADVFWDFASIETFQRTGQPRDKFMPGTMWTVDHQEVQVSVLDYFLAGNQPNGIRVTVPTVEINALKVRRRHVPENDPALTSQRGARVGETDDYWWRKQAKEAGASATAE